MFGSIRFVWFVAIVAIGAAAFFGFRLMTAQQRIATLESYRESQRRMTEYASDMQPGSFVRADADGLTYRTPQQATVNGQTFVNSVERTIRYSSVFTVFGAVSGNDHTALANVRPGTPVRLLIRGTRLDALYVSP